MKGVKSSLHQKIGGLFLAFFCMLVIAGVIFSWTNAVHHQDMMVIELAGQQHNLLQEIMLEVEESEQDPSERPKYLAALRESVDAFESNLIILTDGGDLLYPPDEHVAIAPTQNPEIEQQLQRMGDSWDIYRGHLDILMTPHLAEPAFDATIQKVESMWGQMLQESDNLVDLYEAEMDGNTIRLGWLQGFIFTAAFGVVGVGFFFTRKSILAPLQELGTIAKRLSYGDLNTPVKITGPREIEAMAHSLDTLRTQIRISQTALNRRAEKLETRLAEHRRELVTAFEFSQEMVSEINLDHLVTSVTDRAQTLMRAETARLCLAGLNDRGLSLVALTGPAQPSLDHQNFGQSKLQIPVEPGKNSEPKRTCINCPVSAAYKASHHLTAPLRSGHQDYGALCVTRTGLQPFKQDEIRALTLLANSAAIAIANACLVESGRRQAEQVASMAERERLAADLHDHLAQTLGFLNLKAERLKEVMTPNISPEARVELNRMQEVLKGAYEEVRTTLSDLRQNPLLTERASPAVQVTGEALIGDLAASLANFQESCGLQTDFMTTTPPDLRLSPLVQKQILNIICEALTNIRRHAQADRVQLYLEHTLGLDELRLTVQDDGRGFDPARINTDNHLGLTIMRARAERCGGSLVIGSIPGRGTKITARFPLNPDRSRLN